LLEVRPFTFALDVAALASRREYLNLDKWLADNVAAYGEEFLHSVIEFLRQKMESEKACRLADPPIEGRTMSLNPTTITIVLRVLRNKWVVYSDSSTRLIIFVLVQIFYLQSTWSGALKFAISVYRFILV
jgi:CCR4-NOT transcription complex subunit 1